MSNLNPYNAIIWIYMQICDRLEITYTLADNHAFPDEKDQFRVFYSEPNNKKRIALSWLQAQLLEKKMIGEKRLWTFAKKLNAALLPALMEKLNPASPQPFKYNVTFSDLGLDPFPGITQEQLDIEMRLCKKRFENSEIVLHNVSIAVDKEEDSEDNEYWWKTYY